MLRAPAASSAGLFLSPSILLWASQRILNVWNQDSDFLADIGPELPNYGPDVGLPDQSHIRVPDVLWRVEAELLGQQPDVALVVGHQVAAPTEPA